MARRAEYPEWLLPYLKPGVYANKAKDGYYLYLAHSEYHQGSSHPVKIHDGFLGKVTEADGLVPSKGKFLGFTTFDYGLTCAVDTCCSGVVKGLCSTYRKNGTLVYVCSVMWFLYGTYSDELYRSSWLSLKYPGIEIPDTPSAPALEGIDRGKRMVADKVESTYGDDWKLLQIHFSPVALICAYGQKRYYCPKLSASAKLLADKYRIPLEDVSSLNPQPRQHS